MGHLNSDPGASYVSGLKIGEICVGDTDFESISIWKVTKVMDMKAHTEGEVQVRDLRNTYS